jgi:hypothetical protein
MQGAEKTSQKIDKVSSISRNQVYMMNKEISKTSKKMLDSLEPKDNLMKLTVSMIKLMG